MSKSIFDFADEDIKKNDTKKIEEMKVQMGEENYSDVKTKINEYQNLSQEELMQKLFQEAEEKKKNGTFDFENLQKMTSQFAPFLDNSQKEMLDTLMKKIK